jgi:XRE family transcriptional regulator, fatty acid utilization regulator
VAKQRIFAGERLRKLRDGRGLNQLEMAKMMGISVSYLSQLEHDGRPLTPTLLNALADNFPLDWQAFEPDAARHRFAGL